MRTKTLNYYINGIKKKIKEKKTAAAKRQQSNKLLQSWIMLYFVYVITIKFLRTNKTVVKSNEKYEKKKCMLKLVIRMFVSIFRKFFPPFTSVQSAIGFWWQRIVGWNIFTFSLTTRFQAIFMENYCHKNRKRALNRTNGTF